MDLEGHADNRASSDASSSCHRSSVCPLLSHSSSRPSSPLLRDTTAFPTSQVTWAGEIRAGAERGLCAPFLGMWASLGRWEGQRCLLLVPPEPGRSKGPFHPGSLCPASSCSEPSPDFGQLWWNPGHLREAREQVKISLLLSLALVPPPSQPSKICNSFLHPKNYTQKFLLSRKQQ